MPRARRFAPRARAAGPRDERLTISRWLSHSAVLVLIVLVPGIGGMFGGHRPTGHPLGLPAGAKAADAPSAAALPSRGFIVKPAGVGPAVQSHREVITYVVQDGDVLGAIAARYGLRLDTLRETNNLEDVHTLALDQKLLIPPTNGILVKVAAGDTVPALAERYHADAAAIIGFNAIRNPLQLTAGSLLMIPDGTGFTASQEATAPLAAAAPSAPRAPREIPHGGSSYNNFPWGWCTWYVASRRNVPWSGDAWMWFGNAQAFGLVTGSTPRVGSILVTWENRYYGHVALVEEVYGDGSYVISEMNYSGFGITDRRHIIPGQVPLIGFIYQ
jgi:surface antigen